MANDRPGGAGKGRGPAGAMPGKGRGLAGDLPGEGVEEMEEVKKVKDMTLGELAEHCRGVKWMRKGCFHCKLGAVKTVELEGDMLTCDVECRIAPLDEADPELLELPADDLTIQTRKMDISKEEW